jgi:predicted enzyme related to lactoylglutathione lyase
VTLELFAGNRVSDIAAARPWYERLFGGEPAFMPHDKEAVWELDEHRYVHIEEVSENPGGALITIFVDDLDERVEAITGRGIEPAERETYSNGVRKVIYRDTDGNEIGFGGPPD